MVHREATREVHLPWYTGRHIWEIYTLGIYTGGIYGRVTPWVYPEGGIYRVLHLLSLTGRHIQGVTPLKTAPRGVLDPFHCWPAPLLLPV